MGAAAIPITLALTAGSTAYQIYSGEQQKKTAQKQQQESQARQTAEAKRQEQLIRERPKRTAPRDEPRRERRFRQGFAANIRTSGLGAPTLGQTTLTGKKLLGQ